MVLPERLIATTLASKYVLNSRIDGDFVECGVWQGVLLIDDYGYWDGARKAIEHFFQNSDYKRPFIQLTDQEGRSAIK